MQYRSRRQLNVHQQNQLVEAAIRGEASYWRQNGVPEALRTVGQDRGIQWDRSIVVDLDIDFPGMSQLFGTLLTQDERFVYFEIDTDSTHKIVEGVARWEDETAKQNLSFHNRGIGAGRGALALKILHELNANEIQSDEECN